MGNLNCCSKAPIGDPLEEVPYARGDEVDPSNTKVASRTREKGSCLKYKKRKCATQFKKSTARQSQSVRSCKITMWPKKRRSHQTYSSNSSLEAQEQMMGVLPSDQGDEEVPFKAKVAPGESQIATPEGLLDECPSEREDEEFPSNSKVTSGLSENAPPEGLLEEFLSDKAIEHTPFHPQPAPRASNNGRYSEIIHLLRKNLDIKKHGSSLLIESKEAPEDNLLVGMRIWVW
ncbi:uncharacterized protein [Dasypus novemcinctus]|uniref:uncharacterized protein n=1 Tax=Dasypus novemcinctus TaxID=9361 RepID=UPI00265EF2FE|nr:uncharacterized protein LOC131274513 [Dasypus novemcinctus]